MNLRLLGTGLLTVALATGCTSGTPKPRPVNAVRPGHSLIPPAPHRVALADGSHLPGLPAPIPPRSRTNTVLPGQHLIPAPPHHVGLPPGAHLAGTPVTNPVFRPGQGLLPPAAPHATLPAGGQLVGPPGSNPIIHVRPGQGLLPPPPHVVTPGHRLPRLPVPAPGHR